MKNLILICYIFMRVFRILFRAVALFFFLSMSHLSPSFSLSLSHSRLFLPPPPHSIYLAFPLIQCDRGHGLPAPSRVWQYVKFPDVSLGTRPRYSQVVDEDVKKPTKQTNNVDEDVKKPNKQKSILSVIYTG